jgi:hypothetical protein
MKAKTKAIMIAASAALLFTVLYPIAIAAMPLATSSTSNTQSSAKASTLPHTQILSTGQTLTFTSTNGIFRVISGGKGNGIASGTLTLSVSGVFRHGYTLTVTGGSLTINGTTYTVSSGSAQMGRGLVHVVGQGTLSNDGAFIFSGHAHANFVGQQYNTLRFDVEINGIEYGVLLLVNVSTS